MYILKKTIFIFLVICLSFSAVEGNTLPVSNAGADQILTQDVTVFLDGSESFDTDGRKLFFSWEQVGGTYIRKDLILNPRTASPSFKPENTGNDEIYRFSLTVFVITDNSELLYSDPTEVKITIRTPQEIKVPENYGTISEAMKKAVFLDKIVVGAIKLEDGNIKIKDGISVVGLSPNQTIITGNGSHVFIIPETSNSSISNLTIKGGKAQKGAAVFIEKNAKINIYNIKFLDNKTFSALGSESGGTVYASENSEAVIKHCVFDGNSGALGSGIFSDGATSNIQNNVFSNNTSTPIKLLGGTSKVTNNVFSKNNGRLSGAIYASGGENVSIVNNTFFSNSLFYSSEDESGIILLLGQTSGEVRNNIFTENVGRSFYVDNTSEMGLFHNDFWNNDDENIDDIKSLEEEENASNNMFLNPILLAPHAYEDFSLSMFPKSPCIDAGSNGEKYNDVDGSVNDIGFSGGPFFFMPELEKSVMEALKEWHREFGKYLNKKDIEGMEALFVPSKPDDTVGTSSDIGTAVDEVIYSNEWEKAKSFIGGLFKISHLLFYDFQISHITLSDDGKTAHINEMSKIKYFHKDKFEYFDIWSLQREPFIFSKEGKWLLKGNLTNALQKWSAHFIKSLTPKGKSLVETRRIIEFIPEDTGGVPIPVSDFESVIAIFPDGEEKVLPVDNGHFILSDLVRSPTAGLYTLYVREKGGNDFLTSLRLSGEETPQFADIPNPVYVFSEQAAHIEWNFIPNALSYTVRITGANNDTESFEVESSKEFGEKISFIFPNSLNLTKGGKYFVQVLANTDTKAFSSAFLSSESGLMEYIEPGNSKASTVNFHIQDEATKNAIPGARINFINSGIIGISDENGNFSVELSEKQDYLVRFSSDNSKPYYYNGKLDNLKDSTMVVKLVLPPNITSTLVPSTQSAGILIACLLLLTTVYFKINSSARKI